MCQALNCCSLTETFNLHGAIRLNDEWDIMTYFNSGLWRQGMMSYLICICWNGNMFKSSLVIKIFFYLTFSVKLLYAYFSGLLEGARWCHRQTRLKIDWLNTIKNIFFKKRSSGSELWSVQGKGYKWTKNITKNISI